MNTSNKSAVIINPNKAYIKWANANSLDGNIYSADYFKELSLVALVPRFDSDIEAKKYLLLTWQLIFRTMLRQWNEDETVWPQEMTEKMFWQWFDVRLCALFLELVPK